MRFPVVLFDLDGTLIDTGPLIVSSFQHVLRQELGIEVSAQEIHNYFGEPLPQTFTRWAPDRAEELADTYRAFNMAHHDELMRQFVGMNQVVERLYGAGVRLAVVTSKRVGTARRGLKVCNLETFFETVVGMDETDRHKPNPEPALLALARLGTSVGEHVLMVGDSKFDILCGRNAGIKTAAVGWTVQSRESLSEFGPDFWVEKPQDLLSLILDT